MKTGKIFAIAVAAVLCAGLVSVLAGANASADDPELEEGYAYGQSLKMDMGTMLDQMEIEKGELLEILGPALVGLMGFDPAVDAAYIDSIDIQDLDFSIALASLVEVVKADADDGYVIEISAGLALSASAAAEMSGMLPKEGKWDPSIPFTAGDVDEGTAAFSIEAKAGFYVSVVMDVAPDGFIRSVTVNCDLFASVIIKTNITVIPYGNLDGLDELEIIYGDAVYKADVDLSLYAKLVFEPNEDGDEFVGSIDGLSVTGSMSFSDDLKDYIDTLAGEGFTDSIMNLSYGGYDIIVDGVLNINEVLDDVDINALIDDLPGDMFKGSYEENLMDFENVKPLDLFAGTALEGLGLGMSELDADGVREVKADLDRIRGGTQSGGDGGDNILLYAAIAAVAVAAVAGVGYFLFIRKP
ncbi:MAG: hypothetical protein FWH44_02865 [Methanomassiliicoccaceae archaeon]|nr:hypothetical protein [Methanomassiliicoccaceae archaeon]